MDEPLQPPQNNKRRRIKQQLLSPHPLLNPRESPLLQRQSKRIIQIRELHPSLLSEHPHPQFVASKSLIIFSSIQRFLTMIEYVII